MLNDTCHWIHHAYRWYRLNHGIPDALTEQFRQPLADGFNDWHVIHDLGSALTRAHGQCSRCLHAAKVAHASQDHDGGEEVVENDGGEEVGENDGGAVSDQSDPGPLEGIVDSSRREPHSTRQRKAYHPASYTIPMVVAPFRELVTSLRHGSRYFDDYTEGPVQEDNVTVPMEIQNLPDNPYAQRTYSSCWTMFKDYGYRIQPSFHQLFNKEPPQLLLPHILSIPPSSTEYRNTESAISIAELLALPTSTTETIDYLLCGRSPADHKKLIQVNPRLDHVEGVDVSVSVDIDSVIWVAHRLQFKLGAKLKIGSRYAHEAPIARNNHVTVTLLHPRSENDREMNGGKRQEWVSTKHGLHTIPHMPFVQCGEGTGSYNAYIFFPRMKHKSEYGRKSVSIIPTPVQDLFVAEVLIPAIKAVSRASSQSYLVNTIGQLRFMMGNKSKPIHFPIDPEQMINLQDTMEEKINGDSDLAMFGSFFFVLDARGIKLWTVDGAGVAPDPLTALRMQSPSLDWDYMMDRTKGELILDLGISFHPPSTADQEDNLNPSSQSQGSPTAQQKENKDAVVGLWDLDFLKGSYKAAGFQAPDVYRSCTMADVGNLQAEMSSTRRRGTHIAFRQSYNLCFEVIRRPGTEFSICSEATAYQGNRSFTNAVNAVVSQLRDSAGKSYGVREEIRVGGNAVLPILKVVHQKVRENWVSNSWALTNS